MEISEKMAKIDLLADALKVINLLLEGYENLTPEQKILFLEKRKAQDNLKIFLKDMAKGKSPYFKYNRKKLYDQYLEWCEENRYKSLIKSNFTKKMKDIEFARAGRDGGNSYYAIDFRKEKIKDIEEKLTKFDSLF